MTFKKIISVIFIMLFQIVLINSSFATDRTTDAAELKNRVLSHQLEQMAKSLLSRPNSTRDLGCHGSSKLGICNVCDDDSCLLWICANDYCAFCSGSKNSDGTVSNPECNFGAAN